MKPSLYERIGGEAAVSAVVMKMYIKILDDDLLAPFFENINVEALRRSQTAFVSFAFGSKSAYTGGSLRAAHRNAVAHGLDDIHFDHVASHLRASMEELNVAPELIDEAMTIVESTRDDVLGR